MAATAGGCSVSRAQCGTLGSACAAGVARLDTYGACGGENAPSTGSSSRPGGGAASRAGDQSVEGCRASQLSMPSHLYSLATAWGAGAAHWRLVELREAERHAAQAMAHHAAAMERARVDSQRVQLELVRASADHEINRLRAHEIGGAGGAGYPPTVAPVQQPPMVPVPPVVSLPPYAAPTPYGHAGLAQYLAASAPPTANLNALADAILTESNANTANAAAGAAASARTASAALAETVRSRGCVPSWQANAATHAQSQSAAKLSRTLADYGFAGGLPPAPYA